MTFHFEYSPTNRAKCRGCKSKIEKQVLRLAEANHGAFGDSDWTYSYRHWDCVSSYILNKIKSSGGGRNVRGFAQLLLDDQRSVLAILGEPPVAPLPPATVNSQGTMPPSTPSTSQITGVSEGTSQKRKRDEARDSQMDIIELSDSSDEGKSGPMKKRKAAPAHHSAPVASTSNAAASSSTAEPSRPSALSALNALNALGAAGTQTIAEQGGEDQEPTIADEVYTVLSTHVVGTNYYAGLVGIGEQVLLVREPQNMYDHNAIRVLNISGLQVGHIPRNVASRLAHLIDSRQITVEGMMTSGNLTGNTGRFGKLGIDVSVLGPSDPTRRQVLERQLTWATPGQQGFRAPPLPQASSSTARSGGMTAAEMEKAAQLASIMNDMAQLDDSSRRETLLNSLCGQDVLELPLHPDPPSVESGVLNANLLKHQKQALLWCINAENPKLPKTAEDKPVQFWKTVTSGNKRYYYNIATKTPQEKQPILGRGGILGDDMGLGKTLTVLSLILATREEEATAGYSGATLIVAPLSVVSNWTTQIEEHLTEDAGISFHLYYGNGRNVTPKFLKSRDIVLTTYNTLTTDCPSTQTVVAPDGTANLQVSSKSGLFAVKWKRCVLDEGHTIRNPKTKTSMACFAVDAERRWVVSGTPIINNPSDLGALMRFLRICSPLDRPEYFTRLLARPLGKRDLSAVELLKALMANSCLRRTKEMQDKDGNALVPLPPVVINVVRVQLDEATREVYDAVERESRELVQHFYANGGHRDDMPMGVNVLSMLTRLRQISLDRHLIPANYLEDLRAAIRTNHHAGVAHVAPINISPEEKERLQQVLAQAIKDDEECPVCFDPLADPRITSCSHYFCLVCISEVIKRQAQCPLDRRPLGIQGLIEPASPPVEEEDQADLDTDEPPAHINEPPSAKIIQLIELLKMQPWDSKSLVFSQFTGFLDRIAVALNDAQIPYVRFDGSMSAKRRKTVLDLFSEPLAREDGVLSADSDDEQTEPDTDDEGYDEYWRKRKGKGNPTVRTIKKPGGGKTNNPVVMLISLKSGALGLNCTVANNVFLMDPWWQEAIESQAIDRVNRLGQKKNVYVYQMVADDTVEDKVLQIQERKKELIKQAFSGTKTVQSQREKKEARLHELIELFGKRD